MKKRNEAPDTTNARTDGAEARRSGKPRETPYRGAYGKAWVEGWDAVDERWKELNR